MIEVQNGLKKENNLFCLMALKGRLCYSLHMPNASYSKGHM